MTRPLFLVHQNNEPSYYKWVDKLTTVLEIKNPRIYRGFGYATGQLTLISWRVGYLKLAFPLGLGLRQTKPLGLLSGS